MKTSLVYAAVMMLFLLGCGDQKPKEEKPPAVEEEKVSEVDDTTAETPMEDVEGPAVEKPRETPAKPSAQKNVTVVGEVIDLVSYATSGARGNTPTGKEILLASAGGGNPLGLLEQKTGEVYVVTMKQANTSANETLLPWVGMDVMAKGDVYRKGGQQLLVMTVIGKKPQ